MGRNTGGGAMPTSVAGEPIPAAAAAAAAGHLRHCQHLSPSPVNLPITAGVNCCCTRVEGRNGREDNRRERISSSHRVESLFWRVPSQSEVEKALSDLQDFMTGAHTCESGWFQRLLPLCDPRTLQSLGYARVEEAFRLLQTDPSVQRMVISMSSDPAVWNAILNNQVVQKLQESLLRLGKEERAESTNEEPELVTLLLKWILDISRAVIMELIQRFSSLVCDLFQLPERKEAASEINSELDIKLRSSLLLSILILVIVVVTRAYGGA
ncbi:hypothetical protein NMG60_11023103 [Bertholletia excelsa]